MSPSQDEIFAVSEGNQWFERNRRALARFVAEVDIPVRLVQLYQLGPGSILEIGAANGYRVASIAESVGARAVAVEVSSEAIRDGQARFPGVRFVQATACYVPLQELFDLIIVNFVFHWIDRVNLLRAVAETDRLLADRGYLIIGDFHPVNLTKVEYHHLPEQQVYTYKQDYAATFLASGLYHAVCLLTGDHASGDLAGNVAENHRIGTWLLRKMLQEHYVEFRR